MSAFNSMLRHTVTIKRFSTGVPDPDGEDYGHGERVPSDLATVKALIQPKPSRVTGGQPEEPTTHGAGTQVTDHTIFLRPTDVTAADVIYATSAGIHTGRTFEVMLVKDAGGQGHHIELDARLIRAAA